MKTIFTKPIYFLLLLIIGIYLYALAPSISPQGDSGELITVAKTLGIAHPPGYPLYTMIGHIFSLIPIGSVAARLNFFSLVLQIFTLVFIYKIVVTITKSNITGTITVGILAFSYTFFLYSLVAEVFPLNNLICSIIIYLTVKNDVNPAKNIIKLLTVLAFLFGLGLSNHHTIVLILPAIFYLLTPHLKKILKFSKLKKIYPKFIFPIIAIIVGLIPYLYLLIRGKYAIVPVAWNYPQSFLDLIHFFLRSDYGTFSPIKDYDSSLANINEKIDQVTNYIRFLADDISLLWLVSSIFSLLIGWFYNKRFTIFCLIGWLFSGPIFLGYANFPIHETSGTAISIVERFYILPNIFLVLLISLGISFVFEKIKKINIAKFIITLFLIINIATVGMVNFKLVNQRDNYLDLQFGRDILNSAPKNALVIVSGDIAVFSTLYSRYIENYREDIALVTAIEFNIKNQFRYLKTKRPEINLSYPESSSISGLVANNINNIPILFFSVNTDNQKYNFSPSVFLTKIYKKNMNQNYESWKNFHTNMYQLITPIKEITLAKNKTLSDQTIIWYYSQMFSELGQYSFENNDYGLSIQFLSEAVKYEPLRPEYHQQLAKSFEKSNQCQNAEKEYQTILEINNKMTYVYNNLAQLYTDCYKDPKQAQKYTDLVNKIKKSNEIPLKNF